MRHHTSGPGGAVGLLLIGQTTSLVGDWLLRVALPLHVLSVTGSAASTALTFAAATLPSILFGPFAGPVVELRDHRATMVGCDLVRAGVVGVLVVGPASDRPWLIYLVVATQASVSELFAPARTAIVPRILGEPDALARANSSLALGNEVALLLGPALGGLVYQSFGLRVAAALDVASYLVSAVATVRIPGSGPESDSRPAKRAPVLRAMTLGVKLVAADRCLGPLMVVSLVLFLGAGMLGPLVVTFARQSLHASGLRYGAILSAQAVGGMAGAVAAGKRPRSTGDKTWVVLTTVLIGVAVLILALCRLWWQAALALLGGGVPTTINLVIVTTLLQLGPPPEFRARVASLQRWTTSLGVGIGTVLAAPVTTIVGSGGGIVVAGSTMALAGVLGGVALPSPLLRSAAART